MREHVLDWLSIVWLVLLVALLLLCGGGRWLLDADREAW